MNLKRGMASLDGAGWAVVDADGEVLEGRWLTHSDAWNEGYAGMYLFSGFDVVFVKA